MRGVYAVTSSESQNSGGSSPHARGLRFADSAPAAHGGIIPACAGFTGHASSPPPRGRDHPRMRGVYAHAPVLFESPEGSSPHARGLPPAGQGRARVGRIIPACAGFTSPKCPCCRGASDHPRMRGVYASRYDSDGKRRGSSPHARGLLGEAAGHPLGDGIIPACAGFTLSEHCDAWGRPGSSPHARGLHGPGHLRHRQRRIIPAHAGFTRPPRYTPAASSDHPRTRGVYDRNLGKSTQNHGSSPHTRGLPVAGGG